MFRGPEHSSSSLFLATSPSCVVQIGGQLGTRRRVPWRKHLEKIKPNISTFWLDAPCPAGKGSKWRPVRFQHLQSMEGRETEEGMEAGPWSRLSLGLTPSLHPSRRHCSQHCISHSVSITEHCRTLIRWGPMSP